MDDSETHMNKKPTKTGSRAPSRDHLTSTYTELTIQKGDRLTNTQPDGLDPTYSLLNFRQNELPIAKNEDPPIASRPGSHKQKSEKNIGNTPYRKICILCLVTSVLIGIVAGVSIHVSQARQSQNTSDIRYQLLWEQYLEMNRTQIKYRQQVHQLNSALEWMKSQNSRLNLSHSVCLRNLSVLNNHISIFQRKIRSFESTKAEICHYLNRRREQTCSKEWITNEVRCYYVSTFKTTFYTAFQECSSRDSRLLEIDSVDETNFIVKAVQHQGSSYWIGKCEDGKVASNVVYKKNAGKSECRNCKSSCKTERHRFICEKSAPLWPDILEKIRDICQQAVEPT